MEEYVSYDILDKLGMEILSKNNSNFIKSELSSVMQKIFLFKNYETIESLDKEYYMKTSLMPSKTVYYIYSEKLAELDKDKLFDVVDMFDRTTLWLYSINIINKLDADPIGTSHELYAKLIHLFHKVPSNGEYNFIMSFILSIRLIKYASIIYKLRNLDEYKEDIISYIKLESNLFTKYNRDNIKKFIDHVLDNSDNTNYFYEKVYLESCMILVKGSE